MKRNLALAVTTLLLTIGLSSAAAHADTVTFTLTNPNQFVTPSGGTLTYVATVSAPTSNAATIDLNGDSFNLSGPFTLDDSDFFNTFFFLNPGQSITDPLFTVRVTPGSQAAVYAGSFTLLGGANNGSNSNLASASFTTTVTPEPSSLVLLGTGLTGAIAVLRKRRFNNT